MSGSIIPTPDYKATDGQSFGTQVEKARLGFISLSLTEYDTDTVPQIAAGSCVEISGSIFQFSALESITGTPVDASTNYIMLTVSGSGDSQTVEASWTTTAPTWNTSKQGWYDATNAKRYVGGCYYLTLGTVYTGKWVFSKERDAKGMSGGVVGLLNGAGLKIGNAGMATGGDLDVTGLGFRPSVVIFLATDATTDGNWSVGFDDGVEPGCIYSHAAGSNTDQDASRSIRIENDASNKLYGEISDLNGDGFTITFTLTGSRLLNFIYLALP